MHVGVNLKLITSRYPYPVKPPIQPLRAGDPKSFQGWILKGLIGEGGQSTIYLAEKSGERAALKMIRKEYLANQKSVDRFFTEIRNLEILNHPNISRILEVEDSGKFLAIEFIDGPNLEDHIKDSGPLEENQWWILAQILASTVDYCHSKGIIHKDISPRNIIIGPTGPVLVDFGISYLEKDARLTSDGETIGTPPFMSPEHFGITATKEMDIFSVGGTLVFAATGHYPFNGTNSSEWRDSILFNPPDFEGLSPKQINVLSPLLYKKTEDRGSLENFSQLIKELNLNGSESKIVKKEFEKVRRESQNKLILKKKHLAVKNNRLRRMVFAASLVSLLSIGLVTFGIITIQNKPDDVTTISQSQPDSGENSSKPTRIEDPSLVPTEQSGTLGGSAQKDNSPINKEIQANLDLTKKYYEANQLDKALTYAKLAADAGNAHGMYDVAFILADQGKSQEAVSWYERAANLGYGDAFWNLGALYMKLGKTESALSWYEKGAKNKNVGSINALGFYFGDKKGDYAKAITYYKKAAELGSVMGMSNLGFMYGELNDRDNAKKWYEKASDLGSIDASINLGYIYEQNADWTNARKYYKRAADKKDPLGMYNLAIVLGNKFGQGDQGCVLLKEALSIESIEANTKKLVDGAIAEGCSPVSSASKTSSTSAKPSDGDLQPVSSYKSSEYSEKLSSNVKSSSIFGRAFLKDLDWLIPLTNSSNESVPPINRVQFRDASLPYGSWWNMPYTLVNSGSVGWQAVVSNLGIQIGHSTGKKVCPEFRFALVQDSLVTYIWTKSVEPCTVP